MFKPDTEERREVADRLRAAHVANRPAKTREVMRLAEVVE